MVTSRNSEPSDSNIFFSCRWKSMCPPTAPLLGRRMGRTSSGIRDPEGVPTSLHQNSEVLVAHHRCQQIVEVAGPPPNEFEESVALKMNSLGWMISEKQDCIWHMIALVLQKNISLGSWKFGKEQQMQASELLQKNPIIAHRNPRPIYDILRPSSRTGKTNRCKSFFAPSFRRALRSGGGRSSAHRWDKDK